MLAIRVDSGEPAATPNPQGLLVYGSDWIFTVKEPEGWIGDTENATKWNCNVFFYPRGQNPERATLIRVTIATKNNDDTEKDLAADMDRYKQSYPDVRFQDFEAAQPSYRLFPKLFLVPDQFAEYVAI